MRAEFDRLRAKLGRIDDKRRLEANREMVGKCFKYHNTYGGDRKWWLYAKVTKAGRYWPEAFTFQNTTRGFEVVIEKGFSSNIGYIEISEAEYSRALAQFKAKLLRALTGTA